MHSNKLLLYVAAETYYPQVENCACARLIAQITCEAPSCLYGAGNPQLHINGQKCSHNINSRKRFRPFTMCTGKTREKIREEIGHNINNLKRFRPFMNVHGADSGRRHTGRKTHDINSQRCFRLLDVCKKERAIGVQETEAQQYKEPKSPLSDTSLCMSSRASEVKIVCPLELEVWILAKSFPFCRESFFMKIVSKSVLRRSCFENSCVG